MITYLLKNITIGIFTILIFEKSYSSIIDPSIAPEITPAQEAWLTNNIALAESLYIAKLDTATTNIHVIYYNLAYINFLKKKISKSYDYVKKALTINKRYGPALYLTGLILCSKGDTTDAIKFFKSAVLYYKFQELPFYKLGEVYLGKNKIDHAIYYLKKARKKNKKFTKTYPLFSKCYLTLKDTLKAIELLEEGLSNSYDAEIIILLADIYNEIGNIEKAKKYYGIFAYLYPHHPSYDRVIKWLTNNGIHNPYTDMFSPPPVRTKQERFFPIGEEKLYSIFFGPVRSGELYTKIADTLNFNGIDVYKVYFSIDSNPVLEFIATVHSDYITYLDRDTKLAVRHYLHTRENKIINDKVYDFDRKNGKFICRVVQEDGHIQYMDKYLPKYATDGTSILFYARQVVKEKRSERVMTIIDENFVISDINFTNKIEHVDLNGKTEMGQLITGKNHYKGILGFTGNFRGWFKNDPTYLPIQADFQIWVGRILIKMASNEDLKLRRFAR